MARKKLVKFENLKGSRTQNPFPILHLGTLGRCMPSTAHFSQKKKLTYHIQQFKRVSGAVVNSK